jgi:hypothetical protein
MFLPCSFATSTQRCSYMRRCSFGKGCQAFEQPAAIRRCGRAVLRIWVGSFSLPKWRCVWIWCRHVWWTQYSSQVPSPSLILRERDGLMCNKSRWHPGTGPFFARSSRALVLGPAHHLTQSLDTSHAQPCQPRSATITRFSMFVFCCSLRRAPVVLLCCFLTSK